MRWPPQLADPDRRRRRSRWSWLVLAPGLALALLSTDPRRWGLSTTFGFLHLVAFRTAVGVGCAGASLLWLLMLLLPRTGRPTIRLVTAGVLLLVAAVHLGIQWNRGWAGADRQGDADLVVLSFNTEDGATTAGQIAELAAAERAQMIALPETSGSAAEQAHADLRAKGMDFQVFSKSDGPGYGATISLLVSTQLGRYRQVDTPFVGLGAIRIEPVDGGGPVLVAVHPASPPPGFPAPEWRAGVTIAVAQCAPNDNVVVAGDFNATIDHAPLRDLRGCADAAGEVGRGAEGTWPAGLPAPFAAPIDHVLFGADHYRALRTRTLRVGGSDHRALLAWLQRTG